MANVSKVDAVNILNGLLVDKINANVAWGTDNMPAGSIPQWFEGSHVNPLGRGNTGQAWCNGNLLASSVSATALYVAALSGALCRKRIVIYFSGNGLNPPQNNVNNTTPWTTVQSDNTAVGWFDFNVTPVAPDWVNRMNQVPGVIPAGKVAQAADISNYCNNLYNAWWNGAGGVVIGTLTNTVCHYSCHNNCHGNRGRR